MPNLRRGKLSDRKFRSAESLNNEVSDTNESSVITRSELPAGQAGYCLSEPQIANLPPIRWAHFGFIGALDVWGQLKDNLMPLLKKLRHSREDCDVEETYYAILIDPRHPAF